MIHSKRNPIILVFYSCPHLMYPEATIQMPLSAVIARVYLPLEVLTYW